MTCQHCCGAESIFDQKSAERDAKRYKRNGPNKTTLSLLSVLKKNDLKGMSALDIGGGVGVIQHELLKAGIVKTTDVDASSAYQKKAKEIALENNTLRQMSFIYGDFIDHEQEIEKYDIVTLERVVCCYPDVQKLIEASVDKANVYYGLVYPRDSIFSKILIRMSHLYYWLNKNPFRTYVHSEKMMIGLVEKQGFEVLFKGNGVFWRVMVFRRG